VRDQDECRWENVLPHLMPRLLQLYRDDPDAGIHSAAEWLLRQWQATGAIAEIDKSLASGKVEVDRHWYENRQGQTLVIIPFRYNGQREVLQCRSTIGLEYRLASFTISIKLGRSRSRWR
jgi:hypothetical protein